MKKQDIIHILKLCRWQYDFDMPQYFHLTIRRKSIGWYNTETEDFDFISNKHKGIFENTYDDELLDIFSEYFGMNFFEVSF